MYIIGDSRGSTKTTKHGENGESREGIAYEKIQALQSETNLRSSSGQDAEQLVERVDPADRVQPETTTESHYESEHPFYDHPLYMWLLSGSSFALFLKRLLFAIVGAVAFTILGLVIILIGLGSLLLVIGFLSYIGLFR